MSHYSHFEVTDWALAEQIREHVQLGHYFVFVLDGKALRPSGRMGRLLGYRAATTRTALPFTTEAVELAGVKLFPAARRLQRLAALVTDRDLYRAEQDTVNLLAVVPNAPDALELVLEVNGAELSRRRIEPGVEGMAIEPISMLLPGRYTAQLEAGGEELGQEASFTVAEYSLAPLSARLVAHQLQRGKGRLRYELLVESYQEPFTRPLRVELREERTQVDAQELTPAAPGRYAGELRIEGEGPFRLRLLDPSDPGRITEVPLPGARKAERDVTVVSELGRELLLSLMPEPGAIPVRGAYLSEGDHLATPLTVDEVVVEEGRIRAHADLEGVTLVIADLASGGFEAVNIGDVKRGGEVKVHLPGPACTVFVGCFIDGHPFEGYTSFIRRTRLQLKVSVPETARPREQLEIRLEVEGAGEVPVLVAVRDQRLGATDTPEVALAASLKRGVAAVTACLADDTAFLPLSKVVELPRYPEPEIDGLRRAPTGLPASRPMVPQRPRAAAPSMPFPSKVSTGHEDQTVPGAPALEYPPRFASAMAPRAARAQREELDDLELGASALDEGSVEAPEADLAFSDVTASGPPAKLARAAAPAPAPEVRASFPEVLFFGVVPVKQAQSLFVRLSDALATYTVQVFACTGGDWVEQRHSFVVDQPVRADLDVPPAVHPEDRVRGRLRVAARSGRARVDVRVDGRAVDLVDAEGRPVDPQAVEAPALLSFPLSPGKVTASVQDLDSGERDVVEALVGTPGRFKSYVRPIRLLERGERLDLDSGEALALRVLPGLDEPFGALVEATADYRHCCCEQTGAKLLAAAVGWLSAKDQAARSKAEDSVLAGVERQRSMWVKGRGFVYYPGQREIAEHYSPIIVRYLWTLEALRELPGLPASMRRAVELALEMADDVARPYRLQRVPARLGSLADAYAACRQPNRRAEVTSLLAAELDLEAASPRGGPQRTVAQRVLGRLVGGGPAPVHDPVERRARLAYGAACLLALGEVSKALRLANVVLAELNEQGRLYSTYDSVPAILLLSELTRAQVADGSGQVRVNGRVMSTAEAAGLAEGIEALEVLSGVAVVETLRLVEEDWTAFSNELAVSVGFRDPADRKVNRFRLGDRVDLLVQLGKGYRFGDLVHVALPASMAWIHAGGRVKRFTVDLQGKSELRVPLVVTHPIAGKEHYAVCVRNMFEEQRVTSPGLLSVSAV